MAELGQSHYQSRPKSSSQNSYGDSTTILPSTILNVKGFCEIILGEIVIKSPYIKNRFIEVPWLQPPRLGPPYAVPNLRKVPPRATRCDALYHIISYYSIVYYSMRIISYYTVDACDPRIPKVRRRVSFDRLSRCLPS